MEQTYTCPNCGAPIAYGEMACGACGMALDWGEGQPPPPTGNYQQQDFNSAPQDYSCPICGALISYGQPFCNNCQSELNWGEQQPPPSYGHQQPQDFNAMQQQYTCPVCNAPVLFGEPFCRYCNNPLQWGEPEITAPSYRGQSRTRQQTQRRKKQNVPQPPMYDMYGNIIPVKKKPLGSMPILIGLVLIIFAAMIITVASNGTFFLPQTENKTQTQENQPITTAPIINKFIFEPTMILSGQSTNLTWDISGADQITIDKDIGTVSAKGSKAMSPKETASYTLTVTNSYGTRTMSALVTVNPVLPVITSFTVSPATVTAGQNVSLQWTTTGATEVSINQGVGTVEPSGTRSVTALANITYILTAKNTAGFITKSVVVSTTAQKSPQIISFAATPDTIVAGQSSTLQWSVSGATSINLDHGIGDVSSNLTQIVSPTTNTTYILSAVNSAGSASANVTVTVGSLSSLAIISFNANPLSITPGNSSILSWNVTGATSITIDPGTLSVASSGQMSVAPSSNTTYTLSASNNATTLTRQKTITVSNMEPPVITSFTANGASDNITVNSGADVLLQWTISGTVNSFYIDHEVGTPSAGSYVAKPNETTIYTLTAINNAGTVTKSITVNVN